MRILGIDFGTKRIGLAVSDENMSLAFPKEVLANDKNTFKRLAALIKEQEISEIVIGDSVDHAGTLNMVSTKIEIFTKELVQEFGLPVHKQKEFMTSVEARKPKDGRRDLHANQKGRLKQKVGERVDASAAALILQRYLDKKQKSM